MRRESRRSPGPHQRAQRRSRSVPPRCRIQRGIVGRAPPRQRKGHKRAVLAQQGLAVFHAQDVIGRAQHRACSRTQRFRRRRAGGGERQARVQLPAQRCWKVRAFQQRCGLGDILQPPCLCAETQSIHTAQRTQQRHTRRCKALGGQRSVGCRQAEHQVRPGGQRSPGTHPGGKQRRSTALHHARAAHAHHRLKAAFFQLRYLPGVSVVERVVFRDDTGCSHGCLASFGRCARINCESWPFFSLFLARFRPCA